MHAVARPARNVGLRTGGPAVWSPAVVAAVAARPWLWRVAGRQALRLAQPGWWRRWPPVPRPAGEYLAFRLECASGDASRDAEPAEVVSYLEWCRRNAAFLR